MNKAIILTDIDGTLALKQNKTHMTCKKSDTDLLCKKVKNLLDLYKSNGYNINFYWNHL